METSHNLEPKDLLDQTIPFDIKKVYLLDDITRAMYSNDPAVITQANQILSEFQQDGTSWQYADIILENSKENNTKFIALNILSDTVQNKWKVLPEGQKSGIKEFLSKMIITLWKQEEESNSQHLLTKLNETLVFILKHELTTTWRDFISEICEASKTHQGIWENTLEILKLLSEEIFDFSKDVISSKRVDELKDNMTNDFTKIYELWVFVLNTYIENAGTVK